MEQIKDRIAAFVREQGRPVSVEEMAAGLLLSPDVVYRAVVLLVEENRLVAVKEAKELELVPA